VLAVVRAGAEPRAPRDVASSRAGTAALRLARHAPGLLDRAVAARLRHLVATPELAGASLAAGLRERHGVRPPRIAPAAGADAAGVRAAGA
jgi:hypothetical protein